jgi:hypothetical protein
LEVLLHSFNREHQDMLNTTLAAPQRHQALTVFPLLTPDPVELPYALLVDALRSGTLEITEVGSGTVPELLATNHGATDVLIVDGEQLIGARQNRMTNRSILLGAGTKTQVPVSCMEQGRWHFVSEQFSPAPQHSPAAVRRNARESEAQYAESAASVPASALAEAQGSVWHSIAEHARRVGATSATGALNDLYDARADDIQSWLAAFPAVEGQVGILAFVGVRPLGLDVIGGRALYARLHERLVRGYVMDALGSQSTRLPGHRRAQAFLDAVGAAARVDAATVGKGAYAVLTGEVIGGELRDGERVAHLSAFPSLRRDASGTNPTYGATEPIAPPSRRRRRSP